MKENDIQLDFNFSRNLDFQKNLNISHINEFLNQSLFRKFSNSKLIQKHLKFLMIELFCCWSECEKQFLSVSMSKRGYKARSRYNPNMISSVCIEAINILKTMKLIDIYPGFYDSSRGISRRTRIKASEFLISEFKKYSFNIYEMLNSKKRESLYLFDKDSNLKEYDDTISTHEIREVINNYNLILLKTFFDIPCLEDPFITRGDNSKILVSHLSVLNKMEYSINWQNSGNFSGGWWDKLDLKSIHFFSKHMLINNAETSFIDFSNFLTLFLSRELGIKKIDLNIDFMKKNFFFISNLDQLNHLILRGLKSKNFNSFFRSFCNDKTKMGITQRIAKKSFKKFVEFIENYNTEIYKNFYKNKRVNWDGFVSRIFYQLLKNVASSSLPIIKIKDKFFFPTKFESNVVNYLKNYLSKIINSDKVDLQLNRSFSYNSEVNKSLFKRIIGSDLKYTDRYLVNKKEFLGIMKNNKLLTDMGEK